MNKSVQKAGPGRRGGQPETRQAILEAAAARFATEGFTGATVRSIAADAGVDAAMINYFFGSKQKLFEEALALRANPIALVTELVKGPIDGFPRRLLTTLVTTWDNAENRPPLLTIISAVKDDPAANGLLRNFLEEVLAGPVAERLIKAGVPGENARLRAGLLASMCIGLVMARYLVRARPIADMPAQAVIDGLVPALEAVLAS